MRDAFLFVCLLACTCASSAQESSSPSRLILGIPIQNGSAQLLARVESTYGRPVQFVESSDMPQYTLAEATLLYDGTPVVKINTKAGMHEAQVDHELMHLLGWAQGVPWPHLFADIGDQDPAIAKFAVDAVYDQICHAYFYPAIRKLGVDPALQEKDGMRKFIEEGSFPTGPIEVSALALYYFRSVVVLRDQELADQLATIFNEHEHGDATTMGQKMVAVFKQKPMSKPSDVIPAFIRVTNIALAGRYRLSVWCLKPVPRGKVTQTIALVAIQEEHTVPPDRDRR